MLDRIKKAAETIDSKRPKIIDQIKGDGDKKGPKPKIRSEMRFGSWSYYFNCDTCGQEYGPISVMIPPSDGGVKLWQSYYMFCPDCSRFVCKQRCWNYYVGKCLNCAPSEEILKAQLRPKIRSEHKIPHWNYYFTCDTCDRDFGPEKTMSKQKDFGYNLTLKYFRKCPNCGRHICRTNCWNFEKGSCTLCNPLSPPEFIVKGEKLKCQYFLVCSTCRNQFGPISEVDWNKVKNIMTGGSKIAVGALIMLVTGSVLPATVGPPPGGSYTLDGAYDVSMAGTSGASPRKGLREVASDAKADLAKCPSCNKWVCIDDCWDKTVGVCKNCSSKE